MLILFCKSVPSFRASTVSRHCGDGVSLSVYTCGRKHLSAGKFWVLFQISAFLPEFVYQVQKHARVRRFVRPDLPESCMEALLRQKSPKHCSYASRCVWMNNESSR